MAVQKYIPAINGNKVLISKRDEKYNRLVNYVMNHESVNIYTDTKIRTLQDLHQSCYSKSE